VALFLLTYGYNDTPERADRRDEHVAHLRALHADGSLVAAGPYEDGTGGAILLSADDQAAAEKLVSADPYAQHDVTKDRYLRPWKVTVGGVA
jgi:uncharacterized protein YciI